MKKEVRGLVKNNKGNGVYKRVYKIEFNYTDKIKIVIDECGYAVFEIETGKNEMAKVITFKKKEKYYNDLNNVKNGKDKNTYVLTCEEEPYKGHDNNRIKDIVKKIEKKENEEIKKIREIKTSSPICNKVIEGLCEAMCSLMDECVIVAEERDKLEGELKEKNEELRLIKEKLEKVAVSEKNTEIEYIKAGKILDNETEVLRLYKLLTKCSKEKKCYNDEKIKIEDEIKLIKAKKSVKTKELQELEDGINLILLKRKCKN